MPAPRLPVEPADALAPEGPEVEPGTLAEPGEPWPPPALVTEASDSAPLWPPAEPDLPEEASSPPEPSLPVAPADTVASASAVLSPPSEPDPPDADASAPDSEPTDPVGPSD